MIVSDVSDFKNGILLIIVAARIAVTRQCMATCATIVHIMVPPICTTTTSTITTLLATTSPLPAMLLVRSSF